MDEKVRLVNANKIDPAEVFGGQNDFAQDCRNAVADLLARQPTINPQDLLLVKELRKQLAEITAEICDSERDFRRMQSMCKL